MSLTLNYIVVGRDGDDLCFAAKKLELNPKESVCIFFPTAGYFAPG